MISENTRLLLEAAEHWLDNFDRAEKGEELLLGTANCQLCKVYHQGEREFVQQCAGCPIKEETGLRYCYSTPYNDVVTVHNADNQEDLLEVVAAEYEFLIDLAIQHGEAHESQ